MWAVLVFGIPARGATTEKTLGAIIEVASVGNRRYPLRIDPVNCSNSAGVRLPMLNWREGFVVSYPASPYIEERNGG